MPKTKNMSPLEEWEQAQIFKWVYSHQLTIPELELCAGSMNGVKVGAKTRAKLKGQGLRSGFPDIDLPVLSFPYSGLCIELKRRKGGVVSARQKYIHKLLERQGRKVVVCRGWQEAVNEIIGYLGLDLPLH